MTKPSIIRYLALSYCWLGLAYYLSDSVKQGELWVAIIGIVILGVPVLVMGLYSATVCKIHNSHAFLPGSWMRDFFGRRFLSTLFWIIFSLLAGFSALFWFGTLKSQEWMLVIVSVPIFFLIFTSIYRKLGTQYKRYITTQKSLGISQWLYALAASLLLICLSNYLGVDESPLRLSELMKEEQTKPLLLSESILVQYAVRYAGYYDQARAVAFASISQQGSALPLVITFFFGVVLFFNIGVGFSAFLIPRAEFRRIALPLDDTDEPGQPAVKQVVFVSAVVSFLVLFVFIPGMAGAEGWLRQHPEVRANVAKFEVAAIPHFEMIEDQIYKLGTIESLRQLQVELLRKHSANMDKVAELADIGFLKMVENVDPYLDWYYSLPAEYLRLGALLTNSLENTIKTDLRSYLRKNDPFHELNLSLQGILSENEGLRKEYEAAVASLLRANEVIPQFPKINIDRYIPMDVVMKPVGDIEAIDFETRMAGAGFGAISGIIAAKVVAKAVTKGTIKLAAQAIAKAATIKGASGAAGAAIGALIGSIIPGAGTLVGTAIGAAVGILIGVSIDALLLTVEEILTRDEFGRQIVESIIEAKKSYRADLGFTS